MPLDCLFEGRKVDALGAIELFTATLGFGNEKVCPFAHIRGSLESRCHTRRSIAASSFRRAACCKRSFLST
jgi:hypothetical protein